MRRYFNLFALTLGVSAFVLSGQLARGQQEDKKKSPPPAEKKAAPAEGKKDAKPGDAKMSAEEEAMMKAWMAAATPGENHKHLEGLIGKWSYVTKWRMAEEQPWEESTGSAENKWVLDGRFVHQSVKGDPSDKSPYPFEGMGITGYDNGTKKYVNSWVDNMGTGIMNSEGTCDASGKVITYTGKYFDPMSGIEKSARSVARIISADKHVFEMYDKSADGKEFMSLEVTYTRK